MMIDAGLLLLRLVLGALLLGHGLQKAVGAFHGPGLDKAGELFEGWGFVPGRQQALLAACCETLAAVLLVLGLFSPLATAIVVGTMIVAAAPSATNGLWAARGGCELPVVYALLGAGLGLTGPGGYSLDRLLGLPSPMWTPLAGILLGVLASTVPLALRRRVLQRRRQPVANPR